MIYFKVTDKTSTAWQRWVEFRDLRSSAMDAIKGVTDAYNIESEQVKIIHRHPIGFYAAKGMKSPKGFRKKDNLFLPDKRTKIGKQADRELGNIKVQGSNEAMHLMFGTSPSVHKDRMLMYGMGVLPIREGIAISIQPEVWEEAQKSNAFDRPDGLEEITYSEYEQLVEEHKSTKEAPDED